MSKPEAKLAIRPITVLSPVRITIPVQVPSTALVEKKAIFLVSNGFSFVKSGPLDCGSDSPVNEELSTLKPWACTTRISAGTRSPNLTSITSPTTRSSAFMVLFSPFLNATAC